MLCYHRQSGHGYGHGFLDVMAMSLDEMDEFEGLLGDFVQDETDSFEAPLPAQRAVR